MAFLSDVAAAGLPTLIRDIWPFDRVPGDPADFKACKAWQAVPFGIAELADWLAVISRKHSQDRARPYAVIHAPTDDDGDIKYEASLRLQGIIQECNLHPVGTWDGTAFGAQNATQNLVLHGFGHDSTWLRTLRRLNDIITVVTRLVNPRHDLHLLTELPSTVLPLQRRVFERATRQANNTVPFTFDPVIHPEHINTIRNMASRWTMGPALPIGVVRNSLVRRSNHIVIQPGNFVDALVSIEVVCKPRGTRVYFKLERVVQIDASELALPITISTTADGEADDVLAANAEDLFAEDEEMLESVPTV